MSIVDLTELKTRMPAGRRLLGLDLGEKTIGLALSDTILAVATPLQTLTRRKFAVNAGELSELIAQYGVGGLIVGLPLALDGSDGPAAQSARAFTRNFAEQSDVLIALWDERFSTVAVTRTLLEADSSRKRRAEVIDKMAAAYILQGALDRLRNMSLSA